MSGADGLGEFGLIGHIRSLWPMEQGSCTGIGDDCAVIPQKDGLDTLVSTDMLVEGVHFLIEDAAPFDAGWKSAAVNISDIAAMGGKPVATFLSFALPKSLSPSWVEEFMQGYKTLSDRYGVPLLGGDTTSSLDRLCISVTVLGECRRGGEVFRSGACPGDLVCVTGTLGDAGAGLKTILGGLHGANLPDRELLDRLVTRHYRPLPRVQEGMRLAAEGVHAMMDISDGIGSDIRHILEESGGVGAEIDTALLPLSADVIHAASIHGWDPLGLAIDEGEDYELLFTVAPEDEPSLSVPHTVIGRIVPGSGVKWLGTEEDFHGFHHF